MTDSPNPGSPKVLGGQRGGPAAASTPFYRGSAASLPNLAVPSPLGSPAPQRRNATHADNSTSNQASEVDLQAPRISDSNDVSTLHSRRRSSLHSIKSLFAKPKLSTVLDRLGYATSEGLFFDSSNFNATKITSFGMYLAEDVSDLITKPEEWKPVDLLVLKFEALRDLHASPLGIKLAQEEDVEEPASNREPEENRSSSNSVVTDSTGTTLDGRRRRSFSSESIRSVSSKKSTISRVSKLWRSRSATSLANLADGPPSGLPVPLFDTFRRSVLRRISHLILSIDVCELYRLYSQTDRGTASSFTRFLVSYLAAGLATMPSPISGFLFTGLREWILLRKGNPNKVEKLLNAIRGTKDVGWSVPLIFVDEYGMNVWDDLRDIINGVMLTNIFFDTDGTRRIMFGAARSWLTSLTTKLSLEISLRSDFLVLNTEMVACPPQQLPAALVRAHIHWAGGLNFVAWYSGSSRFDALADVQPPAYRDLGEDGIFEMTSHADILRCRDIVEVNVSSLRNKGPYRITADLWNRIFNDLSDIPNDLIDALGDWMEGCEQWSEFDGAIYYKPLLPELPCYLEIDHCPSREDNSGSLSDAIPDAAPSVTYFGVDWYGYSRRTAVANAIQSVMFELLDKQLLASARYNIDLSDQKNPSKEPLAQFDTLINVLAGIINKPTNATRWVLSLPRESCSEAIIAAVADLKSDLLDERAQIWLPTKAALLAGVKDRSPNVPVWAVAGVRNGTFHMFISDNHPQIGEAVLHLYLKYRYGWSTGQCLLAETLISAQRRDLSDLSLPCPARLIYQIDHACPSQLLTIVRDGPKALKALAVDTRLSSGEISFLSALCRYFSVRSEYWLIDHKRYLDNVRCNLADGYVPRNALEMRMGRYVSQCTLDNNGGKRLLAVARGITSELRKRGGTVPVSPVLGGPGELWTLCYFFMVFWKAVRRNAYEEILVALEAMNPMFLPERDQVAVALEMITTNSNLVTIFGMNSLSMAGALHPLLRKVAEREKNKSIPQVMETHKDVEEATTLQTAVFEPDDESAELSTVAFGKSILNAYIFVYPILLDIILVVTLGSGIFASDRMSVDVQESASLVLLVMFPIVGAVMNSIGRTVTYYFYQRSIPVMIAAFYRRLAAACLLFTVFGIMLGGITYYRTDDLILAGLTLVYAISFGLFMILFCVLIIMRDPEEYFFKSQGPAAVMKMLPILIPNAFICRFVLNATINPYIIWSMYVGSLILSTIYMTYSYTRIAAAYLRWPDAIHITPREKILEAYGKHHPPPELQAKEDVYTFGRRSRRWERFATEWFSSQAEEALRTRSRKTEPLVRKRLSSWFWEKLLMGWYIPRSGIKPPKPFSSEWDSVVKQAIAELKKKYTVEKINRGGILFDNELPAICFGFLYFFTLFADRWTVLIASGKALFFFTDGIESDYVQGTLAGTIYLLLSSGILELTLTKFYEKHKRISMRSVAESEGPDDIITRHRRALSKIYASELCRFLVFSGLILIITTACVITIGFKDDRMDLIYTYALSAFGFAGLLLGLFTKLFVTSLESTVNLFLTIAIVISIGGGVAAVRILASSEYAVIATAASGWLFALGCIASRYSEKLRSVHYKVQVSPALTSSGQRHIGHHTTPATDKARSLLAAKLIANRKSCQKIRPSSSLGDSIRSRLQFILETMGGLPPSHLLRTAVPSISSLIEDLLSDFRLGQLKVFRCKEALQPAGIRHAAISARPAAVTHLLYVFLPPKDSETADEEDLAIILEALLHEIAEAKGMSHAAACISEMFVGISTAWLKEEKTDWIRNIFPSRIKRQLRVADDGEKASMWCKTKDVVASKACLNLEVDEIWNRKISHQDRVFLVGVARLWWDSFDESIQIGALPRNLAKYLDTAPMSIVKLLSAKCGDKQEIDLKAHASQSILASLLALNIQKLYDAESDKLERAFSAPSSLLPQRHYSPTTWTRFFSLALDIQVSLFLALTADERFGREVASHTLLLRLPCALVNWMSRGLLNTLQHGTLYRWDPAINNTLKQMERGLSRIHHHGRSMNGHHGVSCVETYHGATHTIVAVVTGRETNAQSGRDWLTVDRYALGGPKPPNWKPGGMKPVSRAFFEEVTIKHKKTLRIAHEHIFDNNGNTCKSHVYVYRDPTSIVAQHRYVVPKAVDSKQWKSSDVSTVEGTDEHTFSQLHGNVVVTEATLRRKDAGTGKWVTIQAKYEYNDKNKWGTPDLAVFHGAYPSPWKMIVEYAKSSRGIQDSPRFISVEIQREHERAVVRTKFDYSHPQHVRHKSIRVIPGETDEVIVATPPEIEQDPLSLLSTQAPASLYSSSEFFVSGLTSKHRKSYTLKSPFGKLERIEYYSAPYPTLRRREILWAAWRRGDVPAPFARDLDERFLRAEPLLSAYWWRRDAGQFKGAQRVLREQKHKLSAELQMLDRPVTRTHLQIRYSDLYILGCGGDAHKIYAEGDLDEENRHSIRQSIRANRANELLQVMNLDSGTWPTGGGGVGSCRRDLIHGLHRVRWTAVAELGSAELVQKDYPIEKHIDSIAYVPLWDLDFGTPNENIHRTIPYTTLQAKSRRTTNHVVKTQFVPLIEKLIKGCLLDPITEHDVDEFAKVFIDFHIFFLQYDWTTAWNHVLTQEAWIRGWLQDTYELWSKGQLLDPETPTLRHIEMMFDLIARLLMPLTVEIPAVPVVHASHHGIQAIIGVVAKSLHGSSLIVWDHGILWRERLFGLCTDEAMPKFVQIAFAGITRLVARVVFARADYITPCTSVQNVHWEAWLAGGKYGNALEAASMYARINPVLNGMDVTKFHPDPTQEPNEPTAIMLSHISPVKDVMNAINAARIIVRDFKLDTYRLHIYGSAEKDPPYTTECVRAIANYGLEKHVIMKGLGSPSKALPTGSIFVNSSITEGLPLALGEAGLCGLPVVCTDVGGSREVIQDARVGETYGWIVPPSRPMQLALAQMRVLTVTDGVANQTTKLDDILGAEDDGASLAARIMYPGVREMRRKLGMKLRERIMAVFSVRRYWREHEQILWLGPLYEQVKRSELPIS